MENIIAITKTNNGVAELPSAETSDAWPFFSAAPAKINAEKSMTILNPSRDLIFISILLNVLLKSELIEGNNKTPKALIPASLSHKKALQKSVTLKMCFAIIKETAAMNVESSIR